MDAFEDACNINAEARLEGMISEAQRTPPSALESLRCEVLAVVNEHARLSPDERITVDGRDMEFQKWRLIHKYIRATPYRDRSGVARSVQWQDALQQVRVLRDTELLDWVCLQNEVARNLESGIRDMRPRKNGPTFLVMLEFVANAKRKALAVLHWAKAGEEEGVFTVNSAWHRHTADILQEHDLLERDEEGRPIHPSDPLIRS